MRMVVEKYIPKELYGFLSPSDGSKERLFFHLSAFDPGSYVGESPIPPIVGEEVEVTFTNEKVSQCNRIATPSSIHGFVTWFSEQKGFGFAEDDNGERYYLHRSEILDGRLPLKDRLISFYVATQAQKPPFRACYVTVSSEVRENG